MSARPGDDGALHATAVELGRLADDDGPGAQDEDTLQVGALGHLSLQSSCVHACANPSAHDMRRALLTVRPSMSHQSTEVAEHLPSAPCGFHAALYERFPDDSPSW